MADSPLEAQAGPTQSQLDAMKPKEQYLPKQGVRPWDDSSKKSPAYLAFASAPVVANMGIGSQQTNIVHNLRKAIVDYENSKLEKDFQKDENALNDCIKKFAENLFTVLYDMVKAQAINVTTTVTTSVTTVVTGACGTGPVTGAGTGAGTGSGVATPMNFTIT